MGKINRGLAIGITICVIAVVTIIIKNAVSERGILVINSPTSVLKNPYPLPVPNSNLPPNEVIATLNKGQRIEYSDAGYGKDFKYYVVKISGERGYVISGDSFRAEAKR